MLERSLEIICRVASESVFGKGWSVVAQQLTLESGRIDLLMADADGGRHLVELKKGAATEGAINQVLGYLKDLEKYRPGSCIHPWILANSVPASVAEFALSKGVRCIEIPKSRCDQIIVENKISHDVLIGPRKGKGIVFGGESKHGLRSHVENKTAFSDMPEDLKEFMLELEQKPNYLIRSGETQSIIKYEGIKIGGINRKHRGGVAYISDGIVISDEIEKHLFSLEFVSMCDSRTKYSHVWYELSWKNIVGIKSAIFTSSKIIDKAIFGS